MMVIVIILRLVVLARVPIFVLVFVPRFMMVLITGRMVLTVMVAAKAQCVNRAIAAPTHGRTAHAKRRQ